MFTSPTVELETKIKSNVVDGDIVSDEFDLIDVTGLSTNRPYVNETHCTTFLYQNESYFDIKM